ncbi:hypothetical protein U8Q06_20920 [Rhizobium beringeri]|uniref:hypothetical protein n=1 Tax=Rhizobium beringeri TaxID=3019934 RepID=UPI002E12E86D|nr:hypothetical protein U8Q06_20920 [Rhizobium beringeri]
MNAKIKDLLPSIYASPTLDKIEGIRASISDLAAKRFEVEMLPPPKEVALERLDHWIAGLSRGYEVEGAARKFLNPTASAIPNIIGHDFGQYLAPFVAPIIREEYAVEIERLYQIRTGVTDAEREADLSHIDDAIFDLELDEERLVRACEERGHYIARRPNASPMIVLAADEELSS